MSYKQFIYLLLFSFPNIIAHPHLFIESGISIHSSSNTLDSLRISFDFDDMYSADLIERFDLNKSNQFETDEIDSLNKNAFDNLKNYNFFVHVFCQQKELKFHTVKDFKAIIKAQSIVEYSFTLDVNIPINESHKVVKIAIYDHTYFIDVSIDKSKVSIDNNDIPANYSWQLIEDKDLAYYYDQIFPYCIVLTSN